MGIEWITPLQASEKWGITERQAQSLCAQGKIAGVVRVSQIWLIPKDATKPIDGRTKVAKRTKINESQLVSNDTHCFELREQE